MVRKNIENENRFLSLLEKENYSLEEDFNYRSLKQDVLIKHNQCGTVFKVRLSNFMILSRRCPNKKCLNIFYLH